jgi:gas vesicle protein
MATFFKQKDGTKKKVALQTIVRESIAKIDDVAKNGETQIIQSDTEKKSNKKQSIIDRVSAKYKDGVRQK